MSLASSLRRAGNQLRAAANAAEAQTGEVPFGFLTRPSLSLLNETIRDMSVNFNGGHIVVDGVNADLDYDGPIVLLPNVQLWGVGMPTMYSPNRTRIKPVHDGPIFLIDDGAIYGAGREAWGGSQIWNFGVVPAGDKRGTVLQLYGGNGSDIRNVMAQHVGGRSFEYGVLIEEGRGYDGQYSTFERVRLPRVFNGFHALRGAPDGVIKECLFYGGDAYGSKGLYLQAGAGGTSTSANSFEFEKNHFQFYDMGHDIGTAEVTLRDGSWENHSGATPSPPLQYATRIRSSVRGLIIDGVSYANFSSVDRTFVIEPGAQMYPIRITGHIDRVKADMQARGQWHLFEPILTA
jgi:hypothetical protein